MGSKTAVVLGGTGSIGKGIVRALAKCPQYEKVTLILRKTMDLPASDGDSNYSKFEQKSMDFEKIPEHADLFKDFDVGFYAIGVSSASVSETMYRKIELDNALALAKMMKDGDCKDVHWVTGRGTNKSSWFLFGKVKGQVEESVGQMGFKRCSFYRPGGVMTSDNSGHLGPKIAFVMKAIDFRNTLTIQADLLGEVIVANSLNNEAKKPVEILENPEMIKIGKALSK